MGLKKLNKQKIIEEVLSCYDFVWSILIHDQVSAGILNLLLSKSDLIDYDMTGIYSIGQETEKWDISAIYLVNCKDEIAKAINSEFKSKKYTIFQVFSLCNPQGLNPAIKCKVVKLEVNVLQKA